MGLGIDTDIFDGLQTFGANYHTAALALAKGLGNINLDYFGTDQLALLQQKLKGVLGGYSNPDLVDNVNKLLTAINIAINARNDLLAVPDASGNKIYLYNELQTVINDLQKNYSDALSHLTDEQKQLVNKAIQTLEGVRRCFPEYFYNLRVQLLKDANDTLTRFTTDELRQVLANSQVAVDEQVNAYTTQANSITAKILKKEDVTEIASALRDDLQETVAVLNVKVNVAIKTALNKAFTAATNPVFTAKLQTFSKDLQTATDALTTGADGYNQAIATYQNLVAYARMGLPELLKTDFENELVRVTDSAVAQDALRVFNQLYAFITTPRRQDLTYTWSTTEFRQANFGIITFSPDTGSTKTTLKVDTRSTITYDPLKFPNVQASVQASVLTSLTDFSLSFMGMLTLEFSNVSFTAGTGQRSNVSVNIKNVKMDGVMAFVQAVEDAMGGVSDAFKLDITPSGVAIKYQSPVLSIGSPGFMVTNISIGVGVVISFKGKPMQVIFALSTFDRKATIAISIYGGGFYMQLTAEAQGGIVAMEMAIEMGAYVGISVGALITGEVRFMVGMYFKKSADSVMLEGYFIALGTLNVWIIDIYARLYMYIRSENSNVTGGCTASFEVSVGFFSLTVEGSYQKTISGSSAESQHEDRVSAIELVGYSKSKDSQQNNNLRMKRNTDDGPEYSPLAELEQEDTWQVMNNNEWNQFYNNFYR